MIYDKREEFKRIDETLLREIRIECNRMQIPFFWIAPVYDDGKGTEYMVALDSNEEVEGNREYMCNALVPGSMGVKLQDDLIRDLIKVMNGFKVVMNDERITMQESDFLPSKVLSAIAFEANEEGGLYYTGADENEKAFGETDCERKSESAFAELSSASHSVIRSVNNPIKIEMNTNLPHIEEDYVEDNTPE